MSPFKFLFNKMHKIGLLPDKNVTLAYSSIYLVSFLFKQMITTLVRVMLRWYFDNARMIREGGRQGRTPVTRTFVTQTLDQGLLAAFTRARLPGLNSILKCRGLHYHTCPCHLIMPCYIIERSLQSTVKDWQILVWYDMTTVREIFSVCCRAPASGARGAAVKLSSGPASVLLCCCMLLRTIVSLHAA